MDTYLGENIARLGFGLMRLPMLGEEIDIEQTKQMVDRFMATGFNYFDTAYGYGDGASERAAKAAIVDRYPRDSFYLATKLPAWAGAKTKEEAEQMFYTSLERTGAGYFDCYLLHNLGTGRTEIFDKFDIWNFIQARKSEGLIRHIGFSMHDSAEALDKVLTEHPEMEFVQLQINYADWEDKKVQSRLCYEVARKHNKPIIIMEPVKGGTISTLPEAAAAPLKAARPEMSIASWGIRFAASLPGVMTVLSGMSDTAQMEDNLSYMTDFQPLSETEYAAIDAARAALDAIPTIPCTGCDYCAKGCPQNINISGTFRAANLLRVYENMAAAARSYTMPQKLHGKVAASECIGCGRCEAVCPQHIQVIDELQKAVEIFEK